jgi:lysozyme
MKYSRKGLALTERFEGCKLQAYRDATGIWTIGYGHTYQVTPGMICTQEQAEDWLAQDVQFAVDFVNRRVEVPLTQGEFDALVDFTFNVGVGNFENSTLLRMLNAGQFKGAAAQFERWDKAGGKVLSDLLQRRKVEEAEFIAVDSEITIG